MSLANFVGSQIERYPAKRATIQISDERGNESTADQLRSEVWSKLKFCVPNLGGIFEHFPKRAAAV